MRKKNLFLKVMAPALMGALLLSGCGSSSANYDGAYATNTAAYDSKAAVEEANYDDYEMADYDYGYDESGSTSGADVSTPSVMDTSRKLITTANLTVETKEFDSMVSDIENYVKANGGYLESINIYNGSRYDGRVVERNANLTVRIPADKLDGFLTEVGNAGNITDRSQSVEDITLGYVDMQAHKETLQGEEERLLELLKNSERVEDMIVLEDKLASVRYQIESMESQLRTYDNKVNYSTVYMNINEVVDYTPVVYEEPSLGERMKEGFNDTIDDIKEWCEDFAVWFVSNIIYLIIWGLIIFAIVKWILYMASDNRAAKKAAKLAKKQKAQYEAYQNTMNGQAPANAQPAQPAQPQPAQSQPANPADNSDKK